MNMFSRYEISDRYRFWVWSFTNVTKKLEPFPGASWLRKMVLYWWNWTKDYKLPIYYISEAFEFLTYFWLMYFIFTIYHMTSRLGVK